MSLHVCSECGESIYTALTEPADIAKLHKCPANIDPPEDLSRLVVRYRKEVESLNDDLRAAYAKIQELELFINRTVPS